MAASGSTIITTRDALVYRRSRRLNQDTLYETLIRGCFDHDVNLLMTNGTIGIVRWKPYMHDRRLRNIPEQNATDL